MAALWELGEPEGLDDEPEALDDEPEPPFEPGSDPEESSPA